MNVNVPVCVAKYCESGDVEQSNTNRSGDASASNANGTWQSNEQGQAGYGGDASSGDATTGGKGCCGSGGDATSGDAYGGDVTQSQEATNSNNTSQSATAESKAIQIAPVNVYVPVCVAKHCRFGDVEQSNTNRSGDASAWNKNHTGQSNEQFQKGVGGDASSGDATSGGSCCKPNWHHEAQDQGRAWRRRQLGQGSGRRRRPDAVRFELEQHVADSDGRVEGDPDRAGERVRAGLHREALPIRRRRAVEHEPLG